VKKVSFTLFIWYCKYSNFEDINTNIFIEAKKNCSFCGATNTKWKDTKHGKEEVIDKNAPSFRRCINCGKIVCRPCLRNMGNEKVGIFSTTFVCPKCQSKMSLI